MGAVKSESRTSAFVKAFEKAKGVCREKEVEVSLWFGRRCDIMMKIEGKKGE